MTDVRNGRRLARRCDKSHEQYPDREALYLTLLVRSQGMMSGTRFKFTL